MRGKHITLHEQIIVTNFLDRVAHSSNAIIEHLSDMLYVGK